MITLEDALAFGRGIERRGESFVLGERFWSKVQVTDGCWLWNAALFQGYGVYGLRDGMTALAHRLSYEDQVGVISEGLQVDHLCRVRNCVRPTHLEAVTPQVNTLRSEAPTAVNARKTHCIRGHLFDAVNTYVDTQGWRRCRACHADVERERRARVRSDA